MPRIEIISKDKAWVPDADTYYSFQHGSFKPSRVHGPVRLLRLLSHVGPTPEGPNARANSEQGSFWFLEEDFQRIRTKAMSHLASEGNAGGGHHLLQAYLRIELRALLAIRRDWTPNFDYLAALPLAAGESAVALIGTIARQAVYDPKKKDGANAARQDILLEGGLTQFVIRFDFPANAGLAEKIQGPYRF